MIKNIFINSIISLTFGRLSYTYKYFFKLNLFFFHLISIFIGGDFREISIFSPMLEDGIIGRYF